MNIVKSVIAGILIGAALFLMPFFIVRFLLFFLIIGTIFRFFIGRRMRGGYRRGFYSSNFTDNIRNMSDEEYNDFKQRFQNNCGYNHYAAAGQQQTNKQSQ